MLLLLFTLSGCSAKTVNKTPPIPDFNFSGNISVTYNNFNTRCKIENKLEVGCVITVESPELLSGLQMKVKNGECTINYGDVSVDLSNDILKKTEFASSLVQSFEKALVTTRCEKLENGNWRYIGEIESGEFVLIQDAASGYPLALEIPEIDLNVQFSNMTKNGG